MAISINQFKSGLTVLLDNTVWSIVSYEHVKPGKGAAFCRARLKNIETGQVLEKTFRDNDKIEEAFVEERKLQFLYRSGDEFHFMDLQDYNHFPLDQDALGGVVDFLKDGLEITGLFYSGQLLNIDLPRFVELRVESTEPGFKGDSVRSGTKPATLETGAVIQVPLFVENDQTIKIDTQNGTYIERV